MNQKRNWLALCGLLASLQAVAAPTAMWTTNDSHVYASSNGFESPGALANSTALTTQFETEGIVFSGTARANGCGPASSIGWSSYGITGDNYVHTFGPGCYTNSNVDTLSMKFSQGLTRLALDAYLLQNDAQAESVQLYNGGNLVASFSLDSVDFDDLALNTSTNVGSRVFYNTLETRVGTLVVDANGAVFDEVRFVESAQGASYGDYLFFDNVRFDAANTVPEPASLALVAVALAAVGLRRRKA